MLTPHEPEYDTHITTTVTHHYASEPVAATRYTAYEPVAAPPTSIRVHDETAGRIPAYLRSISFPATKQDLLRAARANSEDEIGLRRVEQLPDRSYTSLSDLTSALLVTACENLRDRRVRERRLFWPACAAVTGAGISEAAAGGTRDRASARQHA